MQRVDRFLHSVKFWLPTAQQDDILTELSEDIHAQIDDVETERGHKLDDHEVADILKKRGLPRVVAASYLPEQHLIGSTFYPLYRFVLKLVILWIQIPIFVAIIGPINVLTSATPGAAIVETLAQLIEASFIAFGVITLAFAAVDRPKIFSGAIREGASRRTSITDLVNAIVRFALWAYFFRPNSTFDFNGVHLAVTPIWRLLYTPVLMLLLASVGLRIYNLSAAARTKRQVMGALTIDGFGVGIILFLFTTRVWVELTAPGLAAHGLENATKWANINVAILLMTAALVLIVDALQESRSLPQNIQNRRQLPADLG